MLEGSRREVQIWRGPECPRAFWAHSPPHRLLVCDDDDDDDDDGDGDGTTGTQARCHALASSGL